MRPHYEIAFLSVVLALSSALHAVLVHAQAPFDADAYREAKRVATETFLDRTKPKTVRVAAANGLRYPDDKTFAALLSVGNDRREDEEIRLLAFQRHRYDDEYIESVLKILATASDGGAILRAGLIDDVSQRTTFKLPPELRARIVTAFRARLTDRSPLVRLSAFRALVAAQDLQAVDLLVEALRRGRNLPIPKASAIALLDLDGPTKHIATVRPYLHDEDPQVQAQAAHVLSSDPDSRAELVRLATSTSTPELVRVAALRGLSREDESFETYAIALMRNPEETPDVRHQAMKTMAGRLNYEKSSPETQLRFAEAVRRLAEGPRLLGAKGLDVGEEAKKLLGNLRRSFPAVRKRYAQ